MSALAPTLALAAASVGALHSLAPDHWVPIAAVSRARDWSGRRTARVAFACGFGHVTVSVALGLIALVTGEAAVRALGDRSGAIASVVMIAFGAAYGLWGLRRALHGFRHGEEHGHSHAAFEVAPGAKLVPAGAHAHVHAHGGHAHSHSHAHAHAHAHRTATTAWTLFAIYCADPCVAVVPILIAAAPLSRASTLGIVVVYEVATIATIVALTAIARAGANIVRGAWVSRWGDSAAGALIASTGVIVALLGW